ncbi:cell surface glycoprotein MUC18-like [Eublepharis macularius]|uniref:Cell surface glycoprotein MUC18-like n=1 Tax=Eublepharis macularius TaxID=481883 RepID=A0AA97K699_EUBMA|nr:cell surface glycoprotein MUC18-like [Eublepharis macularius]
MELFGRLCLLWAAITVDSWTIASTGTQAAPVTAVPPAPRLSLFPPFSIFVRGEGVRLTCSPPGRQRAAEFLFYKRKPEGQWDLQVQQKKDTWEVSTAQLEPNNTFVCAYSVKNREPLQSAPSNNHVTISIIELPPAATLSLDPKHPVYLQGERVTLTCSAPDGQEVAGYRFYKEQPDQTLRELPHKGQGPYEAFNVDRSSAGKYSCVYWMLVKERGIQSPYSSLVSVALTERPRAPLFSVSPKREVYTSGEFINFTCSARDVHHVSKITFFKDLQQLQVIQLPSSPESTTHVLRLLPQDGGKYSCMYQALESGREISSRKSRAINIAVAVLPAVTIPEASTAVVVAHTYETYVTSSTDSLGVPTPAVLQLTSSQLATEENLHRAAPDGPATSAPSSSQSTWRDSVSSSADPHGSRKPSGSQGSPKPFTSSSDPRSTSQTRTVSKAENGNATLSTDGSLHLPLVAGCSGAGALFLLFLVCIFSKKLKGTSRTSSR